MTAVQETLCPSRAAVMQSILADAMWTPAGAMLAAAAENLIII